MIPIFISRKNEDSNHGKRLHDFLQQHGIESFDSEITLGRIGNGNFREVIDDVLDHTNHMVLIASKLEYISSEWVKAEWDAFENELRSGRKRGNLILLISKKIALSRLPLALRQKQIFYLEDQPFLKMLPYLGLVNIGFDSDGKEKNGTLKKYVYYSFVILILSVLSYFILPDLKPKLSSKPSTSVSIPVDLKSEFETLKNEFLNEGLDKTLVKNKIKEMAIADPAWGYKGAELFQEKATLTPFMQDIYLRISGELIIYTDSIRNAK